MLTVEAAACAREIDGGVNCTPASLPIKRSDGRRLLHACRFGRTPGKNNFGCQAFHRKWTVHPQDFNTLDHACFDVRPDGPAVTAGAPHTWKPFGLLTELSWARTHELHETMPVGGPVRCRHPVYRALGVAGENATMCRVFLTRVNDGELARVNDRVVFSPPTSASVNNPQLQLLGHMVVLTIMGSA
jgi:hypothetical protein